jgi:hypothetical protein
MSLMSMILAFAPALAARLRPQGIEHGLVAEVQSPQGAPSGLKDERAPRQQMEQQLPQYAALLHNARPQALPNCAPGRQVILARRDSGGLGRFLGPSFPGRI